MTQTARTGWFLLMMAIMILTVFPVSTGAQEERASRPAPSSQQPGAEAQGWKSLEQDDSKRVPVREGAGFSPRKIVIDKDVDSLDSKLNRFITIDVREMNVVDVLKFFALKGNFNLVTSGSVQGRVTMALKNVLIRDALDIALISNGLAYHVERSVVHVMSESEYKALYGRNFNDKNIVEIIQLQYVRPEYVLTALENLKGSLGKIVIDQDSGSVVLIDNPASVQRMKEVIAQIEQPLETIVYSLQYAKVMDILEKFKARIDDNAVGSVSADERGNKLIVKTYPGRREEVEALVKSLDEPTKEVLIEARVLQISFKPEMDYGIDWNLDFRKSSYNPLQKLDFSTILLNEPSTSTNLRTNYGRVAYGDININSFDVAVRALKQVSSTRILSNPKILVTNNEEARIHVGDTVPYIISTTSGTGENAITSESVEFVDVGLKLNVIPVINDDGFITMTLKPELSTVVGQIASQGGGIPQVNKTLVETTVMVKDGMTVVLGGLKKDNKINSVKGIPLLMDLPLLGRLFKSDSESIESTEIVIFITPHIVRGDEIDHSFYRGSIKAERDHDGEVLDLKQQLKIKP
jgi:type IV pilus secretin PilQ/predicted competence protein